MIATSIMNGGPNFRCLPKCLYEYIVQQKFDIHATFDDVASEEKFEVINKVGGCNCWLCL